MFGLNSLDVIIGIITVYLIFALACTAIVEAISSIMNSRGKNLRNALKEMFQGVLDDKGKDFIETFYAHPKIYSLSKGANGIPSYIDPRLVGEAVEHILTQGSKQLKDAIDSLPEKLTRRIGSKTEEMPNQAKALLRALYAEAIQKTAAAKELVQQHYGDGGIMTLKQAIDNQPETVKQKDTAGNDIDVPNPTKKMLQKLLTEAESEAASFRDLIEQHFEAVMDRASGWYKHRTQIVALAISALLVVGANVDTLKIASTLSTNPEARKQMVELAKAKVDELNKVAQAASAPAATHTLQEAAETLAKANADLGTTGIQLGWKDFKQKYNNANPEQYINKFVGLIISILAISLGAPFWFDTLNRVMKIRTAGISPREK